MLRSIGKQSGESVESVQEKKKVGFGGKDLQKRKVLSLEWKSKRVMDDESGESMELMEEVPLEELGEAELERLVRGWWREARSWFQRRGEAYWKEPSVIRKEDVDGPASVTKDEERGLFLQDWLHGFPRLFTVTSEHIHFLLFSFSVLHFLVVGSMR